MSRRTDRVAEELRAAISEIIRRELSDPRVGMSTVTAVDVSPDLRHARVYVSVIGEEAARLESIEALQHAQGFVRRQLSQRLRLRVTPELAFELDRGAEHSQRIADLLEGRES